MNEQQEFDSMASDPDIVISVEFNAKHYHVFIGDQAHGYRADRKTHSFGAAVRWLQRQAQQLYPASRYVQDLPARAIAAHWPEGRMIVDTRRLVH
jgi:hypothetical protein